MAVRIMVCLVYAIAALLALSFLAVLYAVGAALREMGVNVTLVSAVMWTYMVVIFFFTHWENHDVAIRVYSFGYKLYNAMIRPISRWIEKI